MTHKAAPHRPDGIGDLPADKKTRTPFGHDTIGRPDKHRLEYLNKIIELYL